MGLLNRLFGAPDRGTAPQLYAAIVAAGRAPHWFVEGGVPDTIDGRFDMIAAILCFVLLRLEAEEDQAFSALLAECFIDDMDGQLREIGIGDVVVGKHMGRMMGMIGGRLGAYREGLEGGTLREALVRNLHRGAVPADAALGHVELRLLEWRDALAKTPSAAIRAGELP